MRRGQRRNDDELIKTHLSRFDDMTGLVFAPEGTTTTTVEEDEEDEEEDDGNADERRNGAN